jgi:hypothetical protein
VTYRYVVGAVLILMPGLVMWMGRPEYFGYLEANYLWMSIVGLAVGGVGAWLCGSAYTAARKRDWP